MEIRRNFYFINTWEEVVVENRVTFGKLWNDKQDSSTRFLNLNEDYYNEKWITACIIKIFPIFKSVQIKHLKQLS